MLVLILFLGNLARALAEPSLACEGNVARYCRCPVDAEHPNDASAECKAEIERLILARKQADYRGGGALTAFGGLNALGPPIPLLSYDGRTTPGFHATSQTENRLSISTPVYASAKDVLAVSIAASDLHLGQKLELDSGQPVAQDFTRFEVGAQYMHQLEKKRNWGLRASIGYAGDDPAILPTDLSYSLTATYGFPGSGRGYWIALVYIANNSSLPNFIPIPGIIYFYKTETFTGLFGFPFTSVQWTPSRMWVYSASLFGPTLQMEAGYGHLDGFQVFAVYANSRQTFIPHQRPNDRDRITLEEQKLGLGFRTPLFARTLFELQAGQSFGRRITLGDGFLSADDGSVDIAASWYASTNFKWAF